VLGGGPIGAELTQAFARLGSKVTVLEMGPRILPREDDDVAALMAQQFAAEGIDLRVDHRALRFETAGGEKRLVAQHQGREVHIAFDALLVAVGRAARLKGFGLEELGVECAKTVTTNAFLQTTFPNIYAAGDVAGPYQFTHTASHQAWYAAVNALFDPFKKFRVDYRVVPSATFVEPEIARVGLNEQEAREKKVAVEVTTYPLADLDRAIADSATRGFVKVLTAPGEDRILGVTIVGEHAADLLAEYVLAMKHGIGLNKILGTIHTYPTMAEANKSAAGAWKLAHQPKGLLAFAERFHAWRRG
jgi:pyruvate/2-oxoglutarate dehydrogenase complex dihydrolipoamide dehydrogenase (E3) component